MDQRTKWIIAGVCGLVAVVLLGRILFGGEDVDDLANSDDADDRLRAVLIISEEGESPQLLQQLASDVEPRVSRQAITVLSKQRTPSHRQVLTELSRSASSPEVRGAAVAALGAYEETSPRELASLLQTRDDPLVRQGAAKALARQGRFDEKATTVTPLLLDALRDGDPEVRIWAIAGITNVSGNRFPGYDASRPPAEQREVIRYIEGKLREKGLLP